MNDNPFNKLNNDYQRINRCPQWDEFFDNTKIADVKPPYLERFKEIKAYYFEYGYISPRQAETVQWAIKKKRPRGVSPRSFRGLPRTVNEYIY